LNSRHRSLLLLRTAWALGPLNIARVLLYRLSVRCGVNRAVRRPPAAVAGPFFRAPEHPRPELTPRQGWYLWPEAFGLRLPPWEGAMATPPRWSRSLITGKAVADPDRPWWKIGDFDAGVGDIKGVWEASRYDWVLAAAQQALAAPDQDQRERALERLNHWLADAARANPPWFGPNWKCGQEASIRVLHLAMAALMLEQVAAPEPGLPALIAAHLTRIAPTLHYALAQDNNHGTSEAAALFVGGSWLADLGLPGGAAWERRGRRWLENRAARLIGEDGSFSQHSVTYHRVLLDTLSMAERWRRALGRRPFSDRFLRRARAATAWLGNLTDPGTGDAPNLGANDGARFVPLTDTDYRDFRPSVQLATALFADARAYTDCPAADEVLAWLDLPPPARHQPWGRSVRYPDGGYLVARTGGVLALLRYPRFRFRPAQSDLLHLDLWLHGENLLRDAGTYSYNPAGDDGADWNGYFPGAAAHNTVQFDGRDQMPRLGRFLFGAWPSASGLQGPEESGEPGGVTMAAGYRDWRGAEHHRTALVTPNRLTVVDRVAGFRQRAVLRWRLPPGDWQWRDDRSLVCGRRVLTVEATVPVLGRRLAEGWESRYYSRKTPLPVVEVEIGEAGTLTTEWAFPE